MASDELTQCECKRWFQSALDELQCWILVPVKVFPQPI